MDAKTLHIPYRCPVCNGHTTVLKPPHIAGDQIEWVTSGTNLYPCPACKSTGIVWYIEDIKDENREDIYNGTSQFFGVTRKKEV